MSISSIVSNPNILLGLSEALEPTLLQGIPKVLYNGFSNSIAGPTVINVPLLVRTLAISPNLPGNAISGAVSITFSSSANGITFTLAVSIGGSVNQVNLVAGNGTQTVTVFMNLSSEPVAGPQTVNVTVTMTSAGTLTFAGAGNPVSMQLLEIL